MHNIAVGNRHIGDSEPVFIIAELGYNFTSENEAVESVEAAADCGVDAIKVQTFRAETVTSRGIDFPVEAGGGNQFDEFKQYEISKNVHQIIFEKAHKKGLIAFSTPSHTDDVALLECLKVPVYKIGSDDLGNHPFMEFVGNKGKPVIFSSGMGTLAEVDEAIQALHRSGNQDIVLLQCVSNYPVVDVSQLNLRILQSYRQIFPVHVGLSDHTVGLTAAVASVALGATVIEKHFTLDKNLPVPDAFFSADPQEMKSLVKAVRETELMLGDGYKKPASGEDQMRVFARKSVIARRPIKAGKRIVDLDLIIKRPGTGIEPKFLACIVGKTARKEIKEETPMEWDMIE